MSSIYPRHGSAWSVKNTENGSLAVRVRPLRSSRDAVVCKRPLCKGGKPRKNSRYHIFYGGRQVTGGDSGIQGFKTIKEAMQRADTIYPPCLVERTIRVPVEMTPEVASRILAAHALAARTTDIGKVLAEA